MKPLLYGYMRVDVEQPDEVVRRAEQALTAYADIEGYCFAVLFHEFGLGYQGAFCELVEALKRTGARHVIVPSLDHISGHAILRSAMLERLELETGALVHSLKPFGNYAASHDQTCIEPGQRLDHLGLNRVSERLPWTPDGDP